MSAILTAWLLTVAVHGGVLMTLAWTLDLALRSRDERARGDAWRESLWRAALFGGVLTATLQIATGLPSLGGRWQFVPPASTAALFTGATLPASELNETASTVPGAAPSRLAASSAHAADEASKHAVVNTRAISTESARPPADRTHELAPTLASAQFAQNWATWLICAWLAGALIALARVMRSLLALRRALAVAAPSTDVAIHADAFELARKMGCAAPEVLSLEALASPFAATRARVVLPDWAMATLDRAQRRAMLAHEIAHISRGDPQWKICVALCAAMFWFIPFARIAQRRLDDIAELACDASAARATGSGRDLAECLAACAERHQQGPVLALAAAMAVRDSSFIQRIEQLLEGIPVMNIESKKRTSAVRALVLAALLASAACLPGIGFAPRTVYAAQDAAVPAKEHHARNQSNISIHNDDNSESTLISFSDDKHKFRASIDGKVAFNDAENDIATLSAGGRAKFEETRAGVTQRIDVSEAGGKIQRRYFVDDNEHPFDDTARAWLAKMVVEVERSGVGAEAREKRLYAAGGAKRVLDEIDQIPNDYARTLYLKLLLAHGRLAAAEVDRAVQLAGAAQTDYERRQELQAIFQTQALEAAQQITFLHQTLHFDSDYERAELLVEVAPSLVDRGDVRQAWLDAALGVKSDYERRRTLTAMLDRPGLDDAQLGSVIKASSSMGSDYERRELLIETIRRAHDVEALAPLYASSVQGLGSDYERREALFALIRSGNLGAAGAGAVLDAAAKIGSSYERREVLVELARDIPPNNNALRERYRQAAAELDENDRREAENALRL